jgi:heptosyltransferase-3
MRARPRILFVTSSRIGDAVLSTGLLDHLLRSHPDARFTVVCGPAAEGVFVRMPGLERLISMEKRPWGRHWLPLWLEATCTVWDLVVDIRGSALGWLVPTRARAKMRRVPGHKTVQLAAVLGVRPPPMPVAWTAPEDRARAAALLGRGPLIAVGPTANSCGKIWPAERFVALFRALQAAAMPGARPVVLAGPGAAERAMAAPPEAVDLCGALSLPEAAAVLARCDLFVGNDSGLMHLAAAAGTPTLGLFGPTPADEYGPAGRRTAVARARTGSMHTLDVADALAAALELVAVPV